MDFKRQFSLKVARVSNLAFVENFLCTFEKSLLTLLLICLFKGA